MSRFALLILACLFSPLLPAASVVGVDIPDTASLPSTGDELVLNGAGVRKKYFIKVYVGALYLPQKADSPAAVYAMDGPKRVLMHFLYDKVAKERLAEGWQEGFEANHGEAQLAALQDRLNAFNQLFSDVQKGDEIRLDYIPGRGTEVWIRGILQGVVEGDDFYTALLKVWLGEHPADKKLKKAMLGG